MARSIGVVVLELVIYVYFSMSKSEFQWVNFCSQKGMFGRSARKSLAKRRGFRNYLLILEILLMRVQQWYEFSPGKSSWGAESLETQLNVEWDNENRAGTAQSVLVWNKSHPSSRVCHICESCFPQHPRVMASCTSALPGSSACAQSLNKWTQVTVLDYLWHW